MRPRPRVREPPGIRVPGIGVPYPGLVGPEASAPSLNLHARRCFPGGILSVSGPGLRRAAA